MSAAGAGRPSVAHGALVTGVVVGLAVTAVIITPMWIFPHLVAAIFTNDPKVSLWAATAAFSSAVDMAWAVGCCQLACQLRSLISH